MTALRTKEDVLGSEMLYLASPYTSKLNTLDERKAEHETKFHEAKDCKAALMKRGLLVLSPIVACHQVSVDHDFPSDYDYWHKMNLRLLAGCSTLAVLKLDGWKESMGLLGEIRHAQAWGLDIVEVEPETFEVITEPREVMRLLEKK